MELYDTIKMLFTSEAMASVITLLFAGIYVTIVMPDRRELQRYREGMQQKVLDLDVIPRLELQNIIATTLHLENEAMVTAITTGILRQLNENREYYARLAGDKVVDIKAEIIQLNEILSNLTTYMQENDIRAETAGQEIGDIVKLIETLYKVLNNLIDEMERNKLINHVDRPAVSSVSSTVTRDQLDAFTVLMNKVMDRQGATKLNRIIRDKKER